MRLEDRDPVDILVDILMHIITVAFILAGAAALYMLIKIFD